MVEALQWFIGLGSTVFLPIIIIIIALFFGVKLSKAIISGITVGIGSIGLDLVIGLLSSNLGTAIQTMGEKYGNSLSIMDIGCGVGGPLAFSTTLGICIILISLGLNLVFVMLGWTKTLNVDIWNFWFPAFLGLVANAISGSFWVGLFRNYSSTYDSMVTCRLISRENQQFLWVSWYCYYTYDGFMRNDFCNSC